METWMVPRNMLARSGIWGGKGTTQLLLGCRLVKPPMAEFLVFWLPIFTFSPTIATSIV